MTNKRKRVKRGGARVHFPLRDLENPNLYQDDEALACLVRLRAAQFRLGKRGECELNLSAVRAITGCRRVDKIENVFAKLSVLAGIRTKRRTEKGETIYRIWDPNYLETFDLYECKQESGSSV